MDLPLLDFDMNEKVKEDISGSENDDENYYYHQDFDHITAVGNNINAINYDSIKPNINFGTSVIFSPLLNEMFNFIECHSQNPLTSNLSMLNKPLKFFSSKVLFKTYMLLFPNFRAVIQFEDKYLLFETYLNLYIFDLKAKKFSCIFRTYNSYIHPNPTFYVDRNIEVFDDKYFIWRKKENYMIFNVENLMNPICFTIKFHPPGPGRFMLNYSGGEEYLINAASNYTYLSRNHNNIFIPDFLIEGDTFVSLKNKTLCFQEHEQVFKFCNLKKKRLQK